MGLYTISARFRGTSFCSALGIKHLLTHCHPGEPFEKDNFRQGIFLIQLPVSSPLQQAHNSSQGGIKFGRQNYQLFHEGFLASSGILKYEGKEIDRKVI